MVISLTDLLDNNFQSRYFKLPIATHLVKELPYGMQDNIAPFVLKHYHKEFEVIGVLSGRCNFIVNHTVLQAEEGDLLLIPPFSLHYGSALPGKAHSHFCFCFDLSLLQSEFLKMQFETSSWDVENQLFHNHPDTRSFFCLASRVYEQCKTKHSGWEYLVEGQLLTFFGLLIQKNLVHPKTDENTLDKFGLNVLKILSQKYNQELSSHEIASQLSYSQSYFCRKFRQTFRLTFQQYLTQYRLSKARLLLSQENISIEQVAHLVGFNHVGYFIRQFHEIYGCTPKQFQKSQVQAMDFQSYYLQTQNPERS